MKTNFQMIKELLEVYKQERRGFVNKQERELIVKTLCIEEMDVLQLRNLRDFAVAHLGISGKKEDLYCMSAIATVIDTKIMDIGGEV